MSDYVSENLKCTLPPIPEGFKPLSHQVAGHIYGRLKGQGKFQLGFLQNDEGHLFKPVQGSVKGQREVDFYEKLFKNNLKFSEIEELKSFVPKYFGLVTFEKVPVSFMKLENVIYNFDKPCVMDIKIGPVTYDKEADAEKINREKNKSPALEKVGFQILGIKVFNTFANEFVKYERSELRILDENSVLEKGLKPFFNACEPEYKHLISSFVTKLMKIQTWFLKQKIFYFIASSLLFVYDANVFKILKKFKNDLIIESGNINNGKYLEDDESLANSLMQIVLQNSDIKMIDFTHTFEFESPKGVDENYLIGLNSLMKFFKRLQM